MTYNEVSGKVIKCALDVHSMIGAGLVESVYEECMYEEMRLQGLSVKRQVQVPVIYRGRKLDKMFFLDLLVEDCLVLELKSLETVLPVHHAQLVTYLKLSGIKLGLLMNFNVVRMKDGNWRKINGDVDNGNMRIGSA